MKVIKLDSAGKSSKVNLNDHIFGVKENGQLLAQAIRVYQSNLRQGTSRVKSRGEVVRTKKKWYRQKGTGNARHGARSAPIFVGGGVAHGPTGLENWKLKLTSKMKKQSLALALSAQAGNLRILESIQTLKGQTKDGQKMINLLASADKRILVILPKSMPEVARSLRNIEAVLVKTADGVTPLEILTADIIVITGETIEVLEVRLKSLLKIVKKPAKVVVAKSKVTQAKIAKAKTVKSKVTKPKTSTTKSKAAKPKETKKS